MSTEFVLQQGAASGAELSIVEHSCLLSLVMSQREMKNTPAKHAVSLPNMTPDAAAQLAERILQVASYSADDEEAFWEAVVTRLAQKNCNFPKSWLL